MRLTVLVVLGSLLVNVLLVLVVAGACGALPARAAEPRGHAVLHPESRARRAVVLPHGRAASSRTHHSYVVEARMGWAIG
jgi:hypothetical protein